MGILSYFPFGAGGEILCFKNVIVNASAWGSSSYDAEYPYEATISLTGITATHFPIVNFSDADDELYSFMSVAQTGNGTITIYAKSAPTSIIIIPAIACWETEVTSGVGSLEETDWDAISAIAQMGIAGDFWSVGDTKSVALNGTVGTLTLNRTLYVYIIGINHEGKNGITWHGFKTAATNGLDIAIVMPQDYTTTDGTLNFNMCHWGNYNYGGWKGCDMRYDILGSTNTAPSGYGAAPISGSRVGYDASSTTATNPVSNTLMSCLPSTLRAVIRPMTVYTDNYSGSPHNTESYVTTSIDYLPLMAEFEIFGKRSRANTYEQNYQTQYEYFANGGSKVKYMHSYNSSTATWWERSPNYSGSGFCCTSGTQNYQNSQYSYGLAPMFLV